MYAAASVDPHIQRLPLATPPVFCGPGRPPTGAASLKKVQRERSALQRKLDAFWVEALPMNTVSRNE